jgi:hypothetical protein
MNWEQIFIRAIVPISFAAIWVLTSLFNRESKGFPARTNPPNPALGPKPGDPTMRWSTPPPPKPPGTRRVPIGDDDILIIQNDPSRPGRPPQPRPFQSTGPRRSSKVRATTPAPAKIESPAARPRLAGVNQNVNQQLANPVALTPLTTIAPMATATGSDLANAPSAPSKTSAVVSVSTLIPLMMNPIRLRETFIVNELLQPPLALRRGRNHRQP